MRASERVRCSRTAPRANSRSDPRPGAPSPDQPVAAARSGCVPVGGISAARLDQERPGDAEQAGTARSTPGLSKPSAWTTTRPSLRSSRGRSSPARLRSCSNTNSGSFAGQPGNVGRIDRVVVVGRVAGAAGPAIAVEGLGEKQAASLLDQVAGQRDRCGRYPCEYDRPRQKRRGAQDP